MTHDHVYPNPVTSLGLKEKILSEQTLKIERSVAALMSEISLARCLVVDVCENLVDVADAVCADSDFDDYPERDEGFHSTC